MIQRRPGFTLVEVLVGLMLMSTVLLFIAGLQVVQSRLTWRAVLAQRANATLLQRIESYEARAFTTLVDGGTCALDTVSAAGTLRFFRCDTVRTPAGSSTQRDITINVLAPIDQRAGGVSALPSVMSDSVMRRLFVSVRARVSRFQPPPAPF
ncbi:MAG: prepilin-type N-terminal cleavage/methylation domain-containing protein [Gemmatimonadaceae bacterium]|nr:prepilin-type N-terminal cleavage/methylation domain-containing protein [Gemmatimonadaceae bacterium]